MREFSLLGENKNKTEKLELNLKNLEIELEIAIDVYIHPSQKTQPCFVDTPIDLCEGKAHNFIENLKNCKFNVCEKTFSEIKELHDIVFKGEEPPLFEHPIFLFDKSLQNLSYLLKKLNEYSKTCTVLVGRSSRLAFLYLVLETDLEDLYWLRSRNESKSGLKDFSVMSGMAQLGREIKSKNYEIVVIVDDLAIRGQTIDDISNSLKQIVKNYKVKIIGTPLLFDASTWIYYHYPNREVPDFEECYGIYLDLFLNKRKIQKERKLNKIFENFYQTPKIGPVTVFAPYTNTLSHVTGDTIEKYYYLLDVSKGPHNKIDKNYWKYYRKLEELEESVRKIAFGLSNNYTKIIENNTERFSDRIVILPRTR
ncbi:MAG: hypothetical protein QXI09_01005 [Candidatus Aenigmatarchaeota archaeon]